jgi:hypothetical protein
LGLSPANQVIEIDDYDYELTAIAEKRGMVVYACSPDAPLWQPLKDDPDRYIYDAVLKGVIGDEGQVVALPDDIEVGVGDVSKRDGWNKAADAVYALPTETWREHVARRQRCLDVR